MSFASAFRDAMRGHIVARPGLAPLAIGLLGDASRSSGVKAKDDLLHRGVYTPRLFQDLVCQPSGRRAPSIEDGVAMGIFKSQVNEGRAVIVPVSLDSAPGSDRDQEGNSRKLTEGLRAFEGTFEAWFMGGPGDQDGWFQWTRTLVASSPAPEDHDEQLHIEPWGVPLEVGTTSAHTTFRHLQICGGVARWPYGYECIFLLLRVRDEDSQLRPGVEVV